jgi:uncharacterized protein (TIGR02246 family)
MTLSPQDRLDLGDVVNLYAFAVDDIGNVDGVVALFTPDAVYDLSVLGMGEILGHAGIGGFFENAFAGMAQNAHFMSNIVVLSDDGAARARVQAYGHAFSLGKDGAMMEVKARYTFDMARGGDGWRIARLGIAMLLPVA